MDTLDQNPPGVQALLTEESGPFAQFVHHPDVAAALQTLLPQGVKDYKLVHLACQIIYTLDLVELELKDELAKKDDVDVALFTLYERPEDEEEKLDGKQGSLNGALTMIAEDTQMSYRQVLRRRDRMECRIAKVFLVLLREYLEAHGFYDYASRIQYLLDYLIKNY